MPNGYTRFSVEGCFRTNHIIGTLDAEFEVTNGLALVGSSLLFTVTPAART